MIFLGVDGGGTKTEFILIDENGRLLSHTIKPTCHYKQTSLENFKKVIREGVGEVLERLNIKVSEIDFSVLGIPGYGEIVADLEDINNAVECILGKDKFKCVNDAVVAWAGSLACNPGINIVAGTGTIGFGMDRSGNTARASGWGPFCGDEGSAYWLGRKIVELFAKESDGRMTKTPLYDIMRLELKIQDDFDLLDIVINKMETKRDEVASLARLLYIAANAGDRNAIEVYSQAAYEHYITIKAIVDKLDFSQEDRILVSYSGGVFNAGKFVLAPLKEYLNKESEQFELITPILNPVFGASLYALTLIGKKKDDHIIENLKIGQKSLNR